MPYQLKHTRTARWPLALLGMVFVLGVFAESNKAIANASNEEIAVSLASLLRASRAVISTNQKHINDASIGDKGLDSATVLKLAKENYQKATGKSLADIDSASLQGRLIQAELKAIVEVMDEAQSSINRKDVGLKGFLPAVFARQVTQKFKAAADGAATLKLTAPKEWVRNRANRPDKWEQNVIETVFKSAEHPKNKHVTEATQIKGRDAYRLILPEYYKQSCLSCHGGPKGERDITGGKKEGGTLGQLGGAISVAIFN
jgi:hypothetical protein